MIKRVYATKERYESEDRDIWTISEDPEETGWETDSGCDGYGLSKEKVDYYTMCINMFPQLVSTLEELDKYLDFSVTFEDKGQIWKINDPYRINKVFDKAKQVLEVINQMKTKIDKDE